MRPYDRAKMLYEDVKDFFKIFDYCATYGVVVSTDDVFCCAYAVHSDYITKYTYNNLDKPNTWFIHLLAGNPKSLFGLVEPLEFVCFERFDNKYRLIPFDKIKRRY